MAARSTKARVHALDGSFSIVRFGGEKKSSGCWKIHGTIVENRSRRDRPIAAMAEMEVVHPYSRFAKEHRILFLSCSILSIDSTIPDCIDKRSISNSSPAADKENESSFFIADNSLPLLLFSRIYCHVSLNNTASATISFVTRNYTTKYIYIYKNLNSESSTDRKMRNWKYEIHLNPKENANFFYSSLSSEKITRYLSSFTKWIIP